MIDFEHVSKEYKKGGKLALEDVNFHVDDGEFVFLLGHSGAGKSTLLKLILRETLPTSGMLPGVPADKNIRTWPGCAAARSPTCAARWALSSRISASSPV